jgi:GNAT superfamily N-acetyltransferase
MEASATSDRDRLLAFELALDREVCDQVHQEDWGTLFLTPSAPLIWDANWVLIEREGLSVEQVVAIADEALGGEGFGHRTICLRGEADGHRLGETVEAEAARWPRWEVERTRYMLYRGGEVDPAGAAAGAREARFAEIEGLRGALNAELMPAGGDGPAAARELLEIDRRYGGPGGDRWFVAPAEGKPMAACRLFRADGIAQVEDVATLTAARERGHAKAIVSAAIAAAQAAGEETIFLTAEAADWPQLFYARLGFETVGDLTVLRRRP